MEHKMKLFEADFNRLKSGIKKREYRLNDEKRKLVRIGDTIRFAKLPNLDEEFVVTVENIEVFPNWFECYAKYYDEDFKDRYPSVEAVVKDTYEGGYYTKEESDKYGCVVFSIKKPRTSHLDATVCYLKKDNKVLMIKYKQKWDHVYGPIGGKFEDGESPLDCIMREFKEETGLTLIEPRLQGISYWQDSYEGIIYIYTATKTEGEMSLDCLEGKLEWIDIDNLGNIKQFEQNKIFTPYLFKDELFEGKFLLDNKCHVLDYKIRKM